MRIAAVAGRAFFGVRVKGKQAFARALVQHHQLRRVGKALEKSVVQRVGANEFMQERHQERAIGAGLDRNPLVGNRRVAGADRVDGDKTPTVALEFRDGNLHGIAVVVFGRADHHKDLGALQVRATKLPEAAANAVNHARGHVHRAKAAVCCVVGRAELAGEQAGQSLHLVTSGEERKLLRIGGADVGQARGQNVVGALPADRFKLRSTAFAAGFAQQRLREPRG